MFKLIVRIFNPRPKWSIVYNRGIEEYGFIDYAGFVVGNFETKEEAEVARDAKRVWSDDYDSRAKNNKWIRID